MIELGKELDKIHKDLKPKYLPTIPVVAANWFDGNKKYGSNFVDMLTKEHMPEDFKEWYYDNNSGSWEDKEVLLMFAWMYGFNVEGER